VSPGDDGPLVLPLGDPSLLEVPPASNQATAGKAKRLLCGASPNFREPSATERSAIAAAFAARNFVVYGKAFDLVEVADPAIALLDPEKLREAIDEAAIALVEVKSTSAARDEHFRGHFFSMSTAELLVAQSLGSLFKFAFVNTEARLPRTKSDGSRSPALASGERQPRLSRRADRERRHRRVRVGGVVEDEDRPGAA
jgi:hypothetical protein